MGREKKRSEARNEKVRTAEGRGRIDGLWLQRPRSQHTHKHTLGHSKQMRHSVNKRRQSSPSTSWRTGADFIVIHQVTLLISKCCYATLHCTDCYPLPRPPTSSPDEYLNTCTWRTVGMVLYGRRLVLILQHKGSCAKVKSDATRLASRRKNKDAKMGATKEQRLMRNTAADDGEHANTGLLSGQPSRVYADYSESPACFQ